MKNEFLKRSISTILLIPFVIFILVKGSFYFNIFITLCFFLSSYEWHKMVKNKLYKIYGILFLLISFYTVFVLRNTISQKYDFFLFILSVCIATDLGGYFFGKLFKGPKLTNISPNKTYAGMIGSFIFTLLIVYILMIYLSLDIVNNNSKLIILIFSLLVSTVSQIGDIIISFFKRKSNVKDTGKIIPGHGGILDRIDGMIFAFPFSYIFYSLSIIK